jgi:glutamine synthetase
VNPYLAVAALIAAGLYGIENHLPLEPEFTGNAYVSSAARVPSTLRDAVEAFEASAAAEHAFGRDVIEHYAHAGRVELAAYDSAVTNWELRRGFERL